MIIREQQFHMVTKPGENVQNVLHVESTGGKKIRGELYTDHVRIVTELDRFSGSRLRLRFGVDTTGLGEGDEVSGSLLLATDEGEFRIPVQVRVTDFRSAEEVPAVSSLSAFTSLAREDPEGALRLFRSSLFTGLIPEEDARLRALAAACRRQPVTEASVEEFLVGAGLKTQVRIRADILRADFRSVAGSTEETITLRRSTWGSFRIEAECGADFIELPKRAVTPDDFIGLIYKFPYRILRERLGTGIRRAVITLRCGFDVIEFRVSASAAPAGSRPAALEAARLRIRIHELYLDYLMKLKDGPRFSTEALSLMTQLHNLTGEDSAVFRLTEAYLLTAGGRNGEAREILTSLKARGMQSESGTCRLAWRFLEEASRGELTYGGDLSQRTRNEFRRSPYDYTLLALMLLTNPDIAASPVRLLRALETAYDAGQRSPCLYAWILPHMIRDDSLVSRLTPLMKDALLFAARGDHLTEELALRTAYLSANEKEYSDTLCRILTEAYAKWPGDGILEAIVRLLMKGRAGDPACFPWYELAVERDIRIIRLYEYYIETMPESRKDVLPLPLRKYFAMSDTLSDVMRARLYANIVRNRQEDPDSYGAYRERMEAFAGKALREGRISEDYAVLYQKFTGRIKDAETAGRLLDAVFTVRVFTDEPDLRFAVIFHDGLRAEERVPLIKGTAYLRRYTKEAVILFENARGRLCAGCVYSEEPVMEKEPFLEMCRKYPSGSAGLLLADCARAAAAGENSERSFDLWLRAAEEERFTDEFRGEARRKILQYTLEHPGTWPFSRLSEQTSRDYIAADKAAFIRVLLGEGEFRKAYVLASRYGFDGISPDLMVRLASRMIDEYDEEYDEELGTFCEHVFRSGKYDERMLSYLTRHFRGSMEEMLRLRKAASDFYIDTFPLDERILTRACFTGTRIPQGPEILRAYASNGGRNRLVRTCLEDLCAANTGTPLVISAFEASLIREMMDDGENVSFPMKLEFLKYCSEAESLTVHEEVLADRILEECDRRNIRFRFFQKLPASLISGYRLMDKVFIEQKADPSDTVTLNYSMSAEGEENAGSGARRSEPMRRMYGGVFSREFTLFYGEVLTYTVTVEHRGEETTGAERSVTSPYADMTGRSAYQRINGMMKALKDGDEGEAREMLRDYLRARNVAESVFRLEDHQD